MEPSTGLEEAFPLVMKESGKGGVGIVCHFPPLCVSDTVY